MRTILQPELRNCRSKGRVHEYASPEHRLAAVALAYTAQEDRAVVVAPDAAERQELTQLIRDELRAAGTACARKPLSFRSWSSSTSAILVLLPTMHRVTRFTTKLAVPRNMASPTTAQPPFSPSMPVPTLLTVATRDGNEASYNPALLKRLTGQSTVYREEQRDVAVGERIRLHRFGPGQPILRSGDFATVERIGEGHDALRASG